MADIDTWLEAFRDRWVSKDVDGVLQLFTDDVEYRETPFKRLDGKQELREEWETVHQQEDISLDIDVFSRSGNRYTVQWTLSYRQGGQRYHWEGVYLIRLNAENRCTEFRQYGEQRPRKDV